jgi:hypothetical protein
MLSLCNSLKITPKKFLIGNEDRLSFRDAPKIAIHYSAIHFSAIHIPAIYISAIHFSAIHIPAIYISAIHFSAIHFLRYVLLRFEAV